MKMFATVRDMDLSTYLSKSAISFAEFARTLRKSGAAVTAQSVMIWSKKRPGTGPSPKMFPFIETATDGAVTRRDLRPDIFGEAPKAKKRRAA